MTDREVPELLPCPFCGMSDLETGGDDKVVGVRCRQCEAQGPNHYGFCEWNTRADRLAEAEAEIARLREALASARTALRHIADTWDSEMEWPGGDVEEAASYASVARAALTDTASAGDVRPFQARVHDWIIACFGEKIGADRQERNHRFIEEALELVQANGCSQSEAHQLVDYVYSRPAGDPHQEVGGVMNTLAALCTASGLDLDKAAEDELARVWTKVEKIRAKQAAKPKHSPLPEATPSAPTVEAARVQDVYDAAISWFVSSNRTEADEELGDAIARALSQQEGGERNPPELWYRIMQRGDALCVSVGFADREEAQASCSENYHCLGIISSAWLSPKRDEAGGGENG